MNELREELIRKDEWYRWCMHMIESSGTVTYKYLRQDGRDVLQLTGYDENKSVILATTKKARSDQYVILCDWVRGQINRKRDAETTTELRAAESFADIVGVDLERQPKEVMKLMLSAMRQIAIKNDLDPDDFIQENQYVM